MITTCHARLRLQVRDMFAQMASALAHSKVRRFPRLRLLLCFPILPHCICKQQVPQTSLILRRAELTVIEASTSAGPTVLHYIVKGSLAILACTSHHITDHDITHHHIITSSHYITLHHTTSHYITHPHMTLRPSPHYTSNITHHTLGFLMPQRFTSHGIRNNVMSLSHHMASHRISDVSERAICRRKKRQGNRRGRETGKIEM